MAWKILNDFVLVEIESPASTHAGGLIIIPEEWRDRDRIGIVVGVGLKVKGNLKVGDRVFYDVYSELWLNQDRKQHRVMREKSVLAVLDPDVDLRVINQAPRVKEDVDKLDFREDRGGGTVKWQNLD